MIAAGEVYNISRGGSRTAAISKMELFEIIVNGFSSCYNSQPEPIKSLRWSFFAKIDGFKPLTIFAKSSILDV